jgi:UDP-glucuronate 4-epimerase
MRMKILVTGAAGFIGFHAARRLLEAGHAIVGLDNLNAYYDPALKEARLEALAPFPKFRLERMDLADRAGIERLFATEGFETVINLAAQAGVRHSFKAPHDYAGANLVGFLNILEGCRHNGVRHLIFASSSSVYGANRAMPFSAHHGADHPLSLYAATKRANELMAHSYAHLFRLPVTGLRFFSVYGPWGRPDMAMYIFADAIRKGTPISLFNRGDMQRDFTYVDDVVEAIARLVDIVPEPDPAFDPFNPDPATSSAPYRIYNIGNNSPTELLYLVELLERHLGRKAVRRFEDMQQGDVKQAWADVDDLKALTGFQPSTPIEIGVERFIAWYRGYHRVG